MTRTLSKPAWAFIISSVALFMVALDNLVVTTALPVIKRDLGASLQDLQWMVNAYTLTFAVLLITGAALGDRFGRKRVFLIGMATFIGGSALAALSPSTEVLILARAIQGVGGAIVTPLTLRSCPLPFRRSDAPSRSAPGAGSPVSRSPSARSSAGPSPKASTGTGSSGSTCRSGSSSFPWLLSV